MAMTPSQAQSAPMGDDTDASMGGAPDQGAGDADQPKYVIEIACMSDGTYQVSVESGAAEDAEEGEGGAAPGESDDDESGGEAGAVPCKSVKSALTLALDITRNNGKMPAQADDSFQAGFAGQ